MGRPHVLLFSQEEISDGENFPHPVSKKVVMRDYTSSPGEFHLEIQTSLDDCTGDTDSPPAVSVSLLWRRQHPILGTEIPAEIRSMARLVYDPGSVSRLKRLPKGSSMSALEYGNQPARTVIRCPHIRRITDTVRDILHLKAPQPLGFIPRGKNTFVETIVDSEGDGIGPLSLSSAMNRSLLLHSTI